MTKNPPLVFSDRPVGILKLPLSTHARILQPSLVMVKIGNDVIDVGAFCYTMCSNKKRKPNCGRKVVLASFRKERVTQIRQVIKTLSIFLVDGGMRPRTVGTYLEKFRTFMDWADTNGYHDCLNGGEATRNAYRLFAKFVEDRFRRHDFESGNAAILQKGVLTLLEAVTGLSDLGQGIRLIKNTSSNGGATEPATEHDFAQALALNASLFHGLSDLVIENKPFPYKLDMPKSLGWESDFLWTFPTSRWFMTHHTTSEERMQMSRPFWCYDYKEGRVASEEEVWEYYKGVDPQRSLNVRHSISDALSGLAVANSNPRIHHRLMLAMVAHNAFFFLFLANTGANATPIADIETDGVLDEATANPGYRTTKWRAHGKEVNVIVPVAFVPALRRFMELRRYILNGESFPYLFTRLGTGRRNPPEKIRIGILNSTYLLLRRIDPLLPKIGSKKIRATVSDYYHRKHDGAIEAAVLQHKETTAEKSYNAGTEAGQHIEMTLFMKKVAQKAQQKVVEKGTVIHEAKQLEDGGVCQSFGEPEAMATYVPIKPNCKTGCLFCTKRILIADEEDTRKVASAAFLMEQLIMGPMSEAEFRPQIVKCDEDLANIRAFEDCADMVDRVKKDVFENGNLTPYFADKYQLFLTLGVL